VSESAGPPAGRQGPSPEAALPRGPWLRILGSSGGCPGPRGACPGYLVGDEHTRLLLDCGPAVVPALRAVHDYARVDGVLVSHMHPDHYLDLVPYAYGLMADLISTGTSERVPLYLPPGGVATLRALDRALGHAGWNIAASSELGPGYPTLAERFQKSGSLLAAMFAVQEYSPDEELVFGGFRVCFHPVEHTVSAFGMRLLHGKSVLAYTGDTRLCAAAVTLAREAGTLLCDATLSRSDNAILPGHMSAAEAGDLANAAGVGRLVLTHVHGDGSRRERLRAEAAKRFGGEVEVAAEGAVSALP